jgi:hypothetical protein
LIYISSVEVSVEISVLELQHGDPCGLADEEEGFGLVVEIPLAAAGVFSLGKWSGMVSMNETRGMVLATFICAA